ncbi:MAG: 3-phosphoshikimate 1-carboxyvinyltransferase [Gammaproteobacteria bacterium]
MICFNQPPGPIRGVWTMPGSKYQANRALILAALAHGDSRIENCPDNDDLERAERFISWMGADLKKEKRVLRIRGVSGVPKITPNDEFSCGASGTLARWALAVMALAHEPSRITGEGRLLERPMGELVTALRMLGARIEPEEAQTLPVHIQGPLKGGRITLSGRVSSQFGSALLTVAPLTALGLTLEFQSPPVSASYLALTLQTMRDFGARFEQVSAASWVVPGGQAYRAAQIRIAPDPVLASYFMALPAVTGGSIRIADLKPEDSGESRFAGLLEAMGFGVTTDASGVLIEEPAHGLQALGSIDLADAPDIVPTLAVLAALAPGGTTTLTGIGHLRYKESDRLHDLALELNRAGLHAQAGPDALRIDGGGRLRAATLDVHGDHRLAMSFALLAIAKPGLVIRGEESVAKSYPGFWKALERIWASGKQ